MREVVCVHEGGGVWCVHEGGGVCVREGLPGCVLRGCRNLRIVLDLESKGGGA